MRRRVRINLQQSTTTQDAGGELVDSWSTYRRPWAKIEETAGQETGASPQEGLVKAVFRIRYAKIGVMTIPTHRAVFAEGEIDRTFNITAVRREDDKRRELLIEATEVQS